MLLWIQPNSEMFPVDGFSVIQIILIIIAGPLVIAAVYTIMISTLKDTAPGWRPGCTGCGKAKPAGQAGVERCGAIGRKYTLGRCGDLRWNAIERDPNHLKIK